MPEQTERFSDFLNEVYGSKVIGALEYRVADILRECDPVAYMEALLEWLDYEGEE